MNSARGHPADYIHHMIASPARYTCMETARRQSQADTAPAPDALSHARSIFSLKIRGGVAGSPEAGAVWSPDRG